MLTSTSEAATDVNPFLVMSTHMCEQHMPVHGVIKGSLAGRRYSATRRRLLNGTHCLCAAAAANSPYKGLFTLCAAPDNAVTHCTRRCRTVPSGNLHANYMQMSSQYGTRRR